ncbi:hypothetical protein [Rhodovulum strictum]|uniref:Outer membrane protein beta-barrel domain-containing protein n=1 Tax=Rhodovulum strictum TaxID=58314 RepID=A0A844B3C3_9RHOB|nr:hypothetical protein [Rhodovulum strictum]MRH20876.1 hypothetical protein [Rhodovulum strictum]
MGRNFAGIVLTAWAMVLAGASGAAALDLLEDTHLIDIQAGSNRSSAAQGLSVGGYELADGGRVSFRDWYTPRFPDLSVLLLTQVSANFGVIWGFGTGERAPKYRIEPAFHLGFVYQTRPFDGATLSLKATHPIGGRLRESACVADYGDIGGVVPVNCRLAADLLPPEETLNYLLRMKGRSDARISLDFEFRF